MLSDKLDKMHAWEMLKVVKDVVSMQLDEDVENVPDEDNIETDELADDQKLSHGSRRTETLRNK